MKDGDVVVRLAGVDAGERLVEVAEGDAVLHRRIDPGASSVPLGHGREDLVGFGRGDGHRGDPRRRLDGAARDARENGLFR